MKNLQELSTRFIKYLTNVRQMSDCTIKSYEADMKKFITWCEETNRNDITNIRVFDLHDYIEWMNGNSNATINRRIVSLREFYKFLIDMEVVNTNMASTLQLRKLEQKAPKSLTVEDAEEMLNRATNDSTRNGLIVMILLTLGLRIEELRTIKHSDISQNRVLIYGKGNRQRFMDLPPKLQSLINKYIGEKEMNGITSKYLITSTRTREQISKRQLQTIVTEYIKDFDESFVVHTTRKTFVSILFNESNVDIATCQQLLNHQSIATTMRYVNISQETKRNAINSNPLLR